MLDNSVTKTCINGDVVYNETLCDTSHNATSNIRYGSDHIENNIDHRVRCRKTFTETYDNAFYRNDLLTVAKSLSNITLNELYNELLTVQRGSKIR